MMPIVGLLVGAAVGFWLGHNFDAVLAGAFVGLIAGLVIHASQKRSAKPPPSVTDVSATRFATLEERVARVEAALERAGLARAAQTIAPPAPDSGVSFVSPYCCAMADAPAADPIVDKSGCCDPHGSATTAEIEFWGEPLMSRSVHTT